MSKLIAVHAPKAAEAWMPTKGFSSRKLELVSCCMLPSLCMVMSMNAAMAGTSGTAGVRMLTPSGLGASSSAGTTRGDAGARIHGLTLAQWAEAFWSRFMSIPLNVSSATDKTGTHCGINQSGPVWFLAAPLGGNNTLSCTIPAGKVIFAPAVTFMNDYPCPDPNFEPASGQTLEAFLTQGASDIVNSFTFAMTLDGRPVKVRRATSSLQSFTAAKDLVASDPCVTGSPQLGVADGQYAVIGPLSPGSHTLHVLSNSPLIGTSDNTFNLTISK